MSESMAKAAGPFHQSIHLSLDNPALQAALDANAERRNRARLASYASLPEPAQVLRRRAHEVRAEVVSHLDDYLETFTRRLTENGVHVHHAQDAAQAVRLVLEIANQVSPGSQPLIAKSKTMVGEEIEINQALERAGMQVIETDLGEFIIQLRGERPAHIITPAVHLRRADVGRTFADKLGLAYTDDVLELTAAARARLRRTFLSADIGLSGVNFGVAETGTLCLVTNEGNGRMVTTLPPVHIALMGIERLVPTLEDLGLMLQLLPRSASGLKLTAYTSLLNRVEPSPTRQGEAPQRHLILVDNGRGRMRSSPLSQALLCIRCGACLNACPIFREIGGHGYVGQAGQPAPYPGPIGSVVSPGLFGPETFGHLAQASSLCGACREACPVDIDLPALLLRVRAGLVPAIDRDEPPTAGPRRGAGAAPQIGRGLTLGLRLYAWISSSPRRYILAQRLAGLVSRLIAPRSAWLRLPAFTGWGTSRDFPKPAAAPFRARVGRLLSEPESVHPARSGGDRRETAAPAGQQESPSGMPALPLEKRFQDEAGKMGVVLHPCAAADLPDAILQFCRSRGVSSLLAWEDQALPAGLPEALRQGGMAVSHRYDPQAELAGEAPPPIGLTGAAAGVAETGSLLVPCDESRPAAASLVVETHLAVLPKTAILPSLQAALKLPVVRQAPSLTLITGPSRTADIEMTLTTGVHGPREVHIFLFE